jgi:hypothetical protein
MELLREGTRKGRGNGMLGKEKKKGREKEGEVTEKKGN